MNSVRNRSLIVCFILALILSLATAVNAQNPTEPRSEASASAPAPSGTAPADDNWHVSATPYLWFAGVHGTAGALGHQVSVHASFVDIFSNFNIGLMGTVEARKKRFLVSTDMMWMRLSDDHGLPANEVGIQSADIKIRQFVLTPAIGYRLVDHQKIKVDATVGFRYWHLGQEVEFTPSLAGGVSTSQNWVDAVGGARIQIPLSEKTVVTILGDAGGGGAHSDYQVAGLLGHKIGKKCVLQAGWRYLDTNFLGGNGFIYDAASSGLLVGVTINLK